MACLGVHFAITEEVATRLNHDGPLSNADIVAFIEHLESLHETLRAERWVAWTENAWDGIHRSLTNGKLELGNTPRHLCILGANERFWVRRDDGQLEYIVNLLGPDDVRRVADAIRGVGRAELQRGYKGIDPESFYALNMSEDDFKYTWENFRTLRAFFERAAAARRWVVFKVDQ